MTKFYEFQGKSVEKALEKACNELDIPAEKIKHEVLEYGSTGIFGLVGIKKAKIKVYVEDKKKRTGPLSGDDPKRPATSSTEDQVEADSSEPAIYPKIDATQVDSGKQGLQKIVDGITFGATVDVNQEREKILFTISGGESGVLIGKRGQTLEAIQYLVEKMINKKSKNRVRILVDVEGYLEKRKNNLQQMASRMAEKAKRSKKPVTIGQMNAHDRRIVHIHLKDESGVRTQSLGQGYYRKMMIFPKKPGPTNAKHTAVKE